MGAEADCELIGDSLLGQPVNTLTTAAFVIGGVLLLRRPTVRWVGIGLVATGIGSFLFHGPMPPGSEWAHDVSLTWLIALVAGVGRSWERFTRVAGLAAIGVLFWLVPAAADPSAVAVTVVTVILLLRRDRTWSTIGPMLLLGLSAIFGRLGATGGPFCDPSSIWQPHGLWHLSAAAAVTWWALAFSSR